MGRAPFRWRLVAAPLRDLQTAMGRVEQGDLQTRCPVVGTTRTLLDGRFDLSPLPAVRVKGGTVELEIYRLA
jgi:HAMP domain-containing protein